ncbi:MAG: nucleoside recognition protein [Clostridiales bacterium]|nr:nucleoside recognition protein [Clostridiales bacterium]
MIWASMIIIGLISAIIKGNAGEITNYIIASGSDAVEIALTMAGIVPIWCGMMKIAEKSGLIDSLTKLMYPVVGKLFPELPKKSPALKYITANIAANIFGLGWAATPSGISAMQSMSELNGHSKTASKSMCMFMVINMSSVQLITINIIAYRTQYGSASPADIIFPGIAATAISTAVGIISVKIAERCAGQ